MVEQQVSTNKFSVAKWIVDTNGLDSGATHTTITDAMASAVSGETIFVKPGTYTEDFTLKAGVSITAFSSNHSNTATEIVGKITFIGPGRAYISNISLLTNADFAIVCSAVTGGTLVITNCYIFAQDNTAISLTNGSTIEIFQGYHTFSSGNALIDMSDGTCQLEGVFQEIGAGVCAISGGKFTAYHSRLTNQYSLTNSADIVMRNCIDFFGNTIITLAGTSTGSVSNCNFSGGSSRCFEVGAGCSLGCVGCVIGNTVADSTTAGGAGTFVYSGLSYSSSQDLITTTTQTGRVFRPGITRSEHQPAFFAQNSSTNSNVTGAGALFKVEFDAEIFDQNDDYDNTTDTFTAPLTGIYKLGTNVQFNGVTTAMTGGQVRFITSNRTYFFNSIGAGTLGTGTAFNKESLVDMDAGDTASVEVFLTSGAGDTANVYGDAGANPDTFFYGCLLF